MRTSQHSAARPAALVLVSFGLVPGALAVAAIQQAAPDATKTVRILYPPNRSVLRKGPMRIVVAAPKGMAKIAATLDGKPLSLQRLPFAESWMAPGALKVTAEAVGDRTQVALWVAQPDLAPGAHAAVIAGQKLALRAGKGSLPTGWSEYYAHQALGDGAGRRDCSKCHEAAAGTIGAARTPAACAACHDEAAVQGIHSHVPQPFARCAMCHDPHGATRPKLLKDEKRKLCSQCHEAGHAKP